jgi:hypothetical protein
MTGKLSKEEAAELLSKVEAWADVERAMANARAYFCEFGDKEYEDAYDFLLKKAKIDRAAFERRLAELTEG